MNAAGTIETTRLCGARIANGGQNKVTQHRADANCSITIQQGDGTALMGGEKMRLIDANKLRKDVLDLPNCYNGFSDAYDKARILDLVDEQPTVNTRSIRHGQWVKMSDTEGIYYACSECGNELTRINSFDPQFDLFPKLECIDKTAYCPNCGCRMDEVEKR